VSPADDPDPRVERSRQAILDAAIEELAEVGYGAMSIESIARRAGVGKATVYRHWRGKLDLVGSALDAMKQEVVVPAEGTVRERITGLLRSLAEFLADSDHSACLPALVSAAQYDSSVAEFQRTFSQSRRQVLVDLITEGIASGELAADLDPDLVAGALAGPLFYERLMLQQPYQPDRVDDIVALILG
jgi:TetR/AcrR family transcriptional regulator of autoinduction and epiphytic fitness